MSQGIAHKCRINTKNKDYMKIKKLREKKEIQLEKTLIEELRKSYWRWAYKNFVMLDKKEVNIFLRFEKKMKYLFGKRLE